MSSYIMVAAIDFGTTYSGYAFSMKSDFLRDPLTIHANQAWNSGKKCLLSLKTPTCLLLNAEKEIVSFGYEAEDAYAELVLDEKHHDYYFFDRFKMKLYENKDINGEMLIEDITGKSMLGIDVFGKSIKALTDHLKDLLETQGSGIIQWNEIQWVLTVPAIWSDTAKQFMRKSANIGNIPTENLLIALEPEAASIYCQYLPKEKLNGMNPMHNIGTRGIRYMVVDLGGGTVDITVHQKIETGKVKELHRAQGNNCGGTAVDKAFIDLLDRVAGFPLVETLKREDPSAYFDLLREFEALKRKVDIGTEGKINISIPFTALNSICTREVDKPFGTIFKDSIYKDSIVLRGDKMRIEAELVKSLFAVAIEKVTEVINGILAKISPIQVSLMLLVGGFSECKLIQSALKNAFPTISIIVPDEAGLAVLKGAVLFGHHPDFIASRIMRYTYGTDSYTEFDPDEHDISRVEILEGKSLCKIFQKIIVQNTPTLIGTKIEHDYQTMGQYQRSMTITIFTCEKEDVKYIDEEGCVSIGEAVVEIPHPSAETRHVAVSYVFGKTELDIIAEELKTNTQCKASINLI